MLDLNSALVIVGILLLVVAWIMYSGNPEMQTWMPWLFGGAGAILLLTGAKGNMKASGKVKGDD